jgi:hypothetical protein
MTDRQSLVSLASKQEVEKARTKGQVVGWIQGAGTVVVIGVVFSMVGWIPLIAIGGLGAYVAYRVVFGGKKT